MSDSLFELPGDPAWAATTTSASAPLAVRMRPAALAEVVGQAHLLGPGSPLRRLVEGTGAAAVILYVPANLLPIMKTSSLFGRHEDTIISGVVISTDHSMP